MGTGTAALYYIMIGLFIGFFAVRTGVKERLFKFVLPDQIYFVVMGIAIFWLPICLVAIALGLAGALDDYDGPDGF